jgi:tRNA (guanine37-N1)-methyltransferase
VRIDVFTQVPHAFGWLTEQRPLATVLGTELELRLLNYRDTTPLRAGQVDDDPYGGGAGMVLRVDVVDAALETAYGDQRPGRIVALTPQGRQLDQALVEELAAESRIAVLSSRFEGFDERIVSHLCTDAVSIGPYVLSGGELPAMVLLDALIRQLPGALNDEDSAAEDSFAAGLLDCPHYTRPESYAGERVPEVLLSGDHARIRRWRLKKALEATLAKRPDLLAGRMQSQEEIDLLEEIRRSADSGAANA